MRNPQSLVYAARIIFFVQLASIPATGFPRAQPVPKMISSVFDCIWAAKRRKLRAKEISRLWDCAITHAMPRNRNDVHGKNAWVSSQIRRTKLAAGSARARAAFDPPMPPSAEHVLGHCGLSHGGGQSPLSRVRSGSGGLGRVDRARKSVSIARPSRPLKARVRTVASGSSSARAPAQAALV